MKAANQHSVAIREWRRLGMASDDLSVLHRLAPGKSLRAGNDNNEAHLIAS